jgi:hypothetical protein
VSGIRRRKQSFAIVVIAGGQTLEIKGDKQPVGYFEGLEKPFHKPYPGGHKRRLRLFVFGWLCRSVWGTERQEV